MHKYFEWIIVSSINLAFIFSSEEKKKKNKGSNKTDNCTTAMDIQWKYKNNYWFTNQLGIIVFRALYSYICYKFCFNLSRRSFWAIDNLCL